MDARERLRGTLLGTALGDALGLACEGMSARAIARRFGRVERFHLLGSRGFVSDDTEQSALVAQALLVSRGDLAVAVRAFRRSLLGWFLRLPQPALVGCPCLRTASERSPGQPSLQHGELHGGSALPALSQMHRPVGLDNSAA